MNGGICRFARLGLPLLAAFWLAGCGQPGGDEPNGPVRAESVTILYDGPELRVGDEKKLGVRVLPPEASGYKLLWTAEPPGRVSVDRDGTIRVLEAGDITVAVSLYVEGVLVDSDDVGFTASARTETVRITNGGVRLGVGLQRKLEAEVLPEGGGLSYGLVWTAYPSGVIGVEAQDGTVKGLREGFAVVTVSLYVSGVLVDYDQTSIAVIDPVALFNGLRGRRVATGGWADNANGGTGIAYSNPEDPIVVCDCDERDPVSKLNAFAAALDLRHQPVFIIVCGDIDFSRGTITDEPGHFPGVTDERVTQDRRLDIRSPDTTIIGINNARLKFGGLRINGNMLSGSMNVIIRNVTFWDARDTRPSPGLDGLLLTGNSRANDHGYDWPTGVWVDHVKFSSGATDFLLGGDWHDTLLNVTLGEITVSNSRFANANEVLLVGGGDGGEFPADAAEEELLWLRSRRRVTLHNNYFHDARTRMPRTRGTQMHMYNNYFRNIGTTAPGWGGGYVMGPGFNAHFVVQGNLFDAPIHQNRILNTTFPGFNTAIVWSENNAGVGVLADGRVSSRAQDGDKPWEPSGFYDYAVAPDVQGLRASIPERAGPTLATVADFMTNFRD